MDEDNLVYEPVSLNAEGIDAVFALADKADEMFAVGRGFYWETAAGTGRNPVLMIALVMVSCNLDFEQIGKIPLTEGFKPLLDRVAEVNADFLQIYADRQKLAENQSAGSRSESGTPQQSAN